MSQYKFNYDMMINSVGTICYSNSRDVFWRRKRLANEYNPLEMLKILSHTDFKTTQGSVLSFVLVILSCFQIKVHPVIKRSCAHK